MGAEIDRLLLGQVLAVDFSFVCPFCERMVHVPKGDPAVMHDVPPCGVFMELNVVDFLQAARRKMAGSNGA